MSFHALAGGIRIDLGSSKAHVSSRRQRCTRVISQSRAALPRNVEDKHLQPGTSPTAVAPDQVGRRPILLLGMLLAAAPEPVAWPSSAEAKEIAELGDESSAALAAEAAGDWKTAAELWKALTDAAEGPGRRDKQRGARFRFRYALCLLELGDKAPAARALEVSARVLRGADVRAALAATLWASGEGEKAEAYWMAATEQGGTNTLTEEYTRDVLLWPPTAVDALARFRAAEAPPAPDAEAEEDLAKFEKARATKDFVREKLGAANSLEDVIFGGK